MRHIAALVLLTAAVAGGAQTADGIGKVTVKPLLVWRFSNDYDEGHGWLECENTNAKGLLEGCHAWTSRPEGSAPATLDNLANGIKWLQDEKDADRRIADDMHEQQKVEIAKLKRQLAAARKRNAQFCVDLKHQNIVVPNCYIGQPPSGPGSR